MDESSAGNPIKTSTLSLTDRNTPPPWRLMSFKAPKGRCFRFAERWRQCHLLSYDDRSKAPELLEPLPRNMQMELWTSGAGGWEKLILARRRDSIRSSRWNGADLSTSSRCKALFTLGPRAPDPVVVAWQPLGKEWRTSWPVHRWRPTSRQTTPTISICNVQNAEVGTHREPFGGMLSRLCNWVW